MAVDDTDPIAHGFNKEIDVFFDNDPVFKLNADAAAKGIKPIGWFATDDPLRSGWAWGGSALNIGVAMIDARSVRARSISSDRRSSSAPSRTGRSSSCSMGCSSRERNRAISELAS
jgi:hypothetical protein